MPGELLRPQSVGEVRSLPVWRQHLINALRTAHAAAREAIGREQARQYNRRVRSVSTMRVGKLVWAFRAPRVHGITKLRHGWRGPARLIVDAWFDNWRVEFSVDKSAMIVHVSSLVDYHLTEALLRAGAEELNVELAIDELLARELTADKPNVAVVLVARTSRPRRLADVERHQSCAGSRSTCGVGDATEPTATARNFRSSTWTALAQMRLSGWT